MLESSFVGGQSQLHRKLDIGLCKYEMLTIPNISRNLGVNS